MLGRLGGRGFSLIELMVTLALLGFLLLLGLPAFTAMVKNTQVRTVADALQNGIRLARAEALRQNQSTVFVLTNATPALNVTPAAGGKNWWVQTVARASGAGASSVPNGSGALTDVASNVTIAGSSALLCFNSNGRLVDLSPGLPGSATCIASAATFTVSQTGADRSLQVRVSVGGQVRMCDPNRVLSTSTPDGC